jgi:MSHA biogenesis protein MshJ
VTRYWTLLAARVAKMTLRERAMILAGILVLTYVVIDTLLISPVLARRKVALDQYAQHQNQINMLRAQVDALRPGKATDPDAGRRIQLETLQQKIAGFEAEVKESSRQLISAERMRTVLQQILARRPGLELVELKTLPRSRITLEGEQQKPGGAARTAQAPEEGADAGALYKHGVQLTVRGRYLDLLAYLKQIEALPAKLYWDKLELTVLEHPTLSMRFTLYTVSLDKAWIQV